MISPHVPLAFFLACTMLVARTECGCGYLTRGVTSIAHLRGALTEPHIFFDIDETILMPDTPFISGMPGTDAFLQNLGSCEQKLLPHLEKGMEAAYYSAAETLVDPGLPSLIADLRGSGRRVLALTSRAHKGKYGWHNDVVIDALVAAGVRFSPLPSGP